MTTGDTYSGDVVHNHQYNSYVSDPRLHNLGLIKLEDGSLVEVQLPEYMTGEISVGFAQPTLSTLSDIEQLLCSAAEPVAKAAKRISQEQNVSVTADVEVGLSLEAGGHSYITKDKTAANLVVKLSIQAK